MKTFLNLKIFYYKYFNIFNILLLFSVILILGIFDDAYCTNESASSLKNVTQPKEPEKNNLETILSNQEKINEKINENNDLRTKKYHELMQLSISTPEYQHLKKKMPNY